MNTCTHTHTHTLKSTRVCNDSFERNKSSMWNQYTVHIHAHTHTYAHTHTHAQPHPPPPHPHTPPPTLTRPPPCIMYVTSCRLPPSAAQCRGLQPPPSRPPP